MRLRLTRLLRGGGEKLGVPLKSDDTEAMQVAAQLVQDAGCEPVIVGNLAAGKRFRRGGTENNEHKCREIAPTSRSSRRKVTDVSANNPPRNKRI